VVNIFVLSTGRCGSTAFSKACEHITNYTTGHESRYRYLGPARFAFPDDHIETDFRLAYHLGQLHSYFPDAFYVHLKRDRVAVARSYIRKYFKRPSPYGQGRAWYEIYSRPLPEEKTIPYVMLGMVDAINANIEHFLEGDAGAGMGFIPIEIEDIATTFTLFWRGIGAEGDIDAALAEFDKNHNAWDKEAE
jgi:hypothetical protein